MEIQRAIQIAKREWENIGTSLEMCGDIGEFDSKDYLNIRCALSENSPVVRNLIEMDNKFPTHRYLTPEAAYVFNILVSTAAERLGLIGESRQNFGRGYSLIRTSCFIPNGTEEERMKQLVFLKFFFPIRGGFNWKFHSPPVKVRLKTIFDKFVVCQCTSETYIENSRPYESQIGLS